MYKIDFHVCKIAISVHVKTKYTQCRGKVLAYASSSLGTGLAEQKRLIYCVRVFFCVSCDNMRNLFKSVYHGRISANSC